MKEVLPLGSEFNWMVFFTLIAGLTGFSGWISFNWWIGLLIGIGLFGGFMLLVKRKFRTYGW